MAHKKSLNNSGSDGFTLIELLVSMTILAVVVGIVYASFAAVVDATEDARAASLKLRSHLFLSRNMTANLAQATQGWLPGSMEHPEQGAYYSPEDIQSGADTADGAPTAQERFLFLGKDQEEALGPADSFSFVSTSPLIGANGLPGFTKWVTYEVITEKKEAENPEEFEEMEAEAILQITESPVMGSDSDQFADDGFQSASSVGLDDDLFGDDVPSPFTEVDWSIPIEAMNVQYYDGKLKKWMDSWDSDEMGYLPWGVDIKINFVDEDQDPDDRDVIEKPDFRLLFAIPAGTGMLDPTPGYTPPQNSYRESPPNS